jgi:hypothetical protein
MCVLHNRCTACVSVIEETSSLSSITFIAACLWNRLLILRHGIGHAAGDRNGFNALRIGFGA